MTTTENESLQQEMSLAGEASRTHFRLPGSDEVRQTDKRAKEGGVSNAKPKKASHEPKHFGNQGVSLAAFGLGRGQSETAVASRLHRFPF